MKNSFDSKEKKYARLEMILTERDEISRYQDGKHTLNLACIIYASSVTYTTCHMLALNVKRAPCAKYHQIWKTFDYRKRFFNRRQRLL